MRLSSIVVCSYSGPFLLLNKHFVERAEKTGDCLPAFFSSLTFLRKFMSAAGLM